MPPPNIRYPSSVIHNPARRLFSARRFARTFGAMALLTSKALRRGFSLFVLISLVGYVAVLVYGDDGAGFVASLGGIRWHWVLVGLGLASMDWLGGGLRLWILAREVHPRPPFWGMVIAGGMGAWGAYVTPLQAGASPMMVY